MPRYTAPVAEIAFLLNAVFKIERYNNLPGFSEASSDTVDAILAEGARFAEEVLQPLNQVGDRLGCTSNPDGSVTSPPGFKDAYRLHVEGGWPALAGDAAYGGQGLPLVLGTVMNEFYASANMAFSMYPGLTQSACSAILAHGDENQKALFAPKLISGEWSGTMNLTEPHCGTDLGLIKTKAVRGPTGPMRCTGRRSSFPPASTI